MGSPAPDRAWRGVARAAAAGAGQRLGAADRGLGMANTDGGTVTRPRRTPRRLRPPAWTSDPRLGVWSDKALAADLGLDQTVVSRWRWRLGIPPAIERKRPGINWDDESRLGVWPDVELARELCVSPSAIWEARVRRGIPPPPRRIREVP